MRGGLRLLFVTPAYWGMLVANHPSNAITTGAARQNSTGLGKQRQLPRRRIRRAEIGERRRVVAGEAMVRELRTHGVALRITHGAIDAIDGQEREGIGANELAHAFEIVGGCQELVALRSVDAVVV